MPQYHQDGLRATPWDSARTKTAFSTHERVALALDEGVLSLVSSGNVVAEAPITDVRLSVSGLASMGAGVLVDFGERRWMVDFSLVALRREGVGASSVMKAFFGLGRFASLKKGRALRTNFIEVMKAAGAASEVPAP